MALPALLGSAGKALSTGSKLAKTANIGTKFLGRNTKKKKPGEQEEKEVSSLTVRPSMSMVPILKPVDMPKADTSESVNTSTSGGDSKATLEENVAYIRKKTIQIDRLLKDSFKLRKKDAKEAQKMRAALARKGKEDRFERKKGVLGKAASKVGKPFSSIFDAIKNYISSILVGFIAIKLLPLLPKFLELLKIVGPVMDFIIGIAGTLLDGLVTFIDWGYQAYDATRGFIKGIGGEGAAEAFDKFSGALNTMINLALVLAMAQSIGGGFGFGGGKKGGGLKGRGGRPTVRPGQGLRPKVSTTGGRGLGRPDVRNPFRSKPQVSGTGTGGGFLSKGGGFLSKLKGFGGFLGKISKVLLLWELYETGKEIFNPEDNIITDVANLGIEIANAFRAEGDKIKQVGGSESAKIINKKRGFAKGGKVKKPKVGADKIWYRVGFTDAPVYLGSRAAIGQTVAVTSWALSTLWETLPTCSTEESALTNAISVMNTKETQLSNNTGYAADFNTFISIDNVVRKELKDIQMRIWGFRSIIGQAQTSIVGWNDQLAVIENPDYDSIING